MSTPLRLEAQFTDAASVQQVHRLQVLLEAGNTELIRSALQLLDWAVSQAMEGRQLASVAPGVPVREFTMPVLERARAATRYALEPAAFARMIELVERPPEPTPALRDLMTSA